MKILKYILISTDVVNLFQKSEHAHYELLKRAVANKDLSSMAIF